ncbi:TMV resistance protein N [Morella rubra]|uniref:TMV resistance protein N n=1 Tax=Morella rubra TaxID=262757 RepID=A0A6A1VLJ7_9ROSI|nr:TMV resistance protein N [Morella rubra]
MSTLEYEMSSLADLSTLRPPMNSSTFHDDSSPIAFPSLVSLDLHCCALSKSDLFTIFNCSSTLLGLDLSGSDIISLPPSIVKFVGLTNLYLKDCKQLQEIPELPLKIKVILVSGCTSLERFLQLSKVWQFNTSDLQELQWLDLTGSHNIVVDVENFVPRSLLFQGYTTGHDFVDQDSAFSVIFPGSTIPNWLHHCEEDSDDNSFEIDISALTNFDEISGIALYIVIGSIFGIHVENDGQPGIHMQYGSKYLEDYDIFEMTDLKDLDHVWLKYIVHNQTNSMIIRSRGFYLVYKHDEVKDDPYVLRGDVDVNLDVLEKEWGNSVHLMDGVQFSKRCRDDDDDHNLESHWHSKRKRHSSPFGMQILDLDDGDDDPGEEVDLELLCNGRKIKSHMDIRWTYFAFDLECVLYKAGNYFTGCPGRLSLKSLKLMSLEVLYLRGCESLQNFPEIECEMKNDCKQLQEIPELPLKIKVILVSGCTSLERFLQLSKVWQFNTSDLQELQWLDLTGSHNIVVDVENFVPRFIVSGITYLAIQYVFEYGFVCL